MGRFIVLVIVDLSNKNVVYFIYLFTYLFIYLFIYLFSFDYIEAGEDFLLRL